MQVNFISWCFLGQRFLALPKSFYSRAVRKKQAVRDQTIYDLSTDYVHKGKQAYAFGFSATGALGVERLMIDRDKSFTKFSGVSQPVKLSFDKTQQLLNVACGYGFTVYISKSSGATYNLYGCGINSDGQLGQHEGLVGKLASEQLICAIPSPHEIDLPLSVEEKKRLYPTLVACGRAHTVISMGLRDETTNSQPFLLTLGNNAFGQCGRQIVDNEVFRPQTSAISRVHLPANVDSLKQVCCGQDHSLLLSSEGVVYAAGLGSDGQTGLGFLDPVDKFTPVQGVLRNEVIDQIASRGDTVLALSRTGKLYAWGNNEYGQIWPAADVLQVPEPVELPTDQCIVPKEAGEEYRNSKIGRILSIACAGSMCAIVNDLGQVFVWGFGCLGLGPVVNFTALPTLIPPGLFVPALPSTPKRLVSVTSGLHHFIARSSDGSLWAWGAPRGGLYCLGIGAQSANKADRQTYPVPINLAAEAVDVACGVDHTVVLARSLGHSNARLFAGGILTDAKQADDINVGSDSSEMRQVLASSNTSLSAPWVLRTFVVYDPVRMTQTHRNPVEEHEAEDPYKVLGVDQDASAEEIRSAYYAQSKLVHPDSFYSQKSGKTSAEAFHRLSAAYSVLSDPHSRRQYDQQAASKLRRTVTNSSVADYSSMDQEFMRASEIFRSRERYTNRRSFYHTNYRPSQTNRVRYTEFTDSSVWDTLSNAPEHSFAFPIRFLFACSVASMIFILYYYDTGDD